MSSFTSEIHKPWIVANSDLFAYFETNTSNRWPKSYWGILSAQTRDSDFLCMRPNKRWRFPTHALRLPTPPTLQLPTSDNCTAVGDFTRFFLGIGHWSRYRLRSSWRTWKREETGEKLMQPELAWNLSNIQIYKNLDFWPFSSLDFRFGAAGAGGGEAEIENMFEYCTIALCSPIEQLEVRNIFNCFVFGHFWSTQEWMA